VALNNQSKPMPAFPIQCLAANMALPALNNTTQEKTKENLPKDGTYWYVLTRGGCHQCECQLVKREAGPQCTSLGSWALTSNFSEFNYWGHLKLFSSPRLTMENCWSVQLQLSSDWIRHYCLTFFFSGRLAWFL